MKKALIGLTIALLAIGAAGCNKDKKESKTAAAAPAAESIVQIEANYQRDDPAAADPNTALTCKYLLVSGSEIRQAEIKTSGKCYFDSLKSSAAGAGSLAADKAAAILSAINSDGSLPASARDKRGCTAINIRTSTKRVVGVQDCPDGSGVGAVVARSVASALGL